MVGELNNRGREARVLSRHTAHGFRVELAAGEGLPQALSGADAVIDASNA